MTRSRPQSLRRLQASAQTPRFVADTVRDSGVPLDPVLRDDFGERFGADLSDVRVHTDARAATSARLLGARAYTIGQHVVFGKDAYRPDSLPGRQLLAHELAHTVQQRHGGARPGSGHEREAHAAAYAVATTAGTMPALSASAPGLAFSLDDWLNSSRDVRGMSYSEIVRDIDEIRQWMSRQMQSTPESARLEEALVELEAEKRRREKRALARKRRRSKRGKKKNNTQKPRSEIEQPRVLAERTSVDYQDKAEIDREVDLIMEWLARDDLKADERNVLKQELDVLAPKFQQERDKEAADRRAARLQRAFMPSGEKHANALAHFARVVQGIVPDSARPGVFLLLHDGEQIAISAEQVETLKGNVVSHLEKGRGRVRSRARDGFSRYREQVRINDESPVISSIAGFLGDAGDPIMAMTMRNAQIEVLLTTMEQQIEARDFPAAAVTMARVEKLANEIYAAGVAFSEDHIRGAGIAVKTLEITRDVSFAIAGSIAAIAAAPVVATAVATGASGTLAVAGTAIGTAGTVGAGTAVVRGGSAFLGELAAGNSLDTAVKAGKREGVRGAKEGVVNGLTGGVAVKAGQALGVARAGLSTTQQVGRRAVAEAAGDFVGGAAGAYMDGGSGTDVLIGGLTSAALGVPGNLVGAGFKNPGVRSAAENLTGVAAASTGSYLAGGSTEDIIQAGATSLVAANAIRRATPGKPRTTVDGGATQKQLTDGGRSSQKALTDGGRSNQKLLTDGGLAPPKQLTDGGRSQQKLLTDGGRLQQKQLPPASDEVSSSGLELDYSPQPSRRRPHNEISLEPSSKPPLELDYGPQPERPVTHNEIDLGPTPNVDDLKLYRGSKHKVPGVKKTKPTFGQASDNISGTFNRTGMHFNELNAAEIAAGVRAKYDETAGRPKEIKFRIDAEANDRVSQTDRSFKQDESVYGAQPKDSSFTNSGYERGHLVQREAMRGDADVELAADSLNMVVPMTEKLNRGKGSLWRKSEADAMRWAKQYGHVDVEVTPVYDAKPKRLKDGTPIPKGIRRKITAPDGTVLEDQTHLNF